MARWRKLITKVIVIGNCDNDKKALQGWRNKHMLSSMKLVRGKIKWNVIILVVVVASELRILWLNCVFTFAVWQLCVDIMIKCDYYLIVLFGNANYIIPFNCSGWSLRKVRRKLKRWKWRDRCKTRLDKAYSEKKSWKWLKKVWIVKVSPIKKISTLCVFLMFSYLLYE